MHPLLCLVWSHSPWWGKLLELAALQTAWQVCVCCQFQTLTLPGHHSDVSLGKTIETWQRALWVKDRGQRQLSGKETASAEAESATVAISHRAGITHPGSGITPRNDLKFRQRNLTRDGNRKWINSVITQAAGECLGLGRLRCKPRKAERLIMTLSQVWSHFWMLAERQSSAAPCDVWKIINKIWLLGFNGGMKGCWQQDERRMDAPLKSNWNKRREKTWNGEESKSVIYTVSSSVVSLYLKKKNHKPA